jgi:hypothetical protein
LARIGNALKAQRCDVWNVMQWVVVVDVEFYGPELDHRSRRVMAMTRRVARLLGPSAVRRRQAGRALSPGACDTPDDDGHDPKCEATQRPE